MDNTVTQEVFKRIDALAEKMGITAQYLWPKLVGWEFWRAVGGVLSTLLFAAVGLLVFYKAYPICKQQWDSCNDNEGTMWSAGVFCLVGAGMFVLGAIAFILGGEEWIATLFFPEARAFFKLVGR